MSVGVRLAYERLQQRSRDAAALYSLLALFPGGLADAGVEAIFGQQQQRLLALIEDESLLERPQPDLLYLPSPFRFFAERQLRLGEGVEAARARIGPAALRFYFDFGSDDESFTGWVPALDGALRGAGEAMGSVIARYNQELPSIEAWLDWAYRDEPCDEPRARAPRLTALLENIYVVTGSLRHKQERFEAALASARRCQDQTGEANVLQALGDLALREDDLKGARQHYLAALAIYPQIGARLGEANVQRGLGNLALVEGNPEQAFDHFRNALAIHVDVGDRFSIAGDLGYLARAAAIVGNHPQAVLLLEESLEIHRAVGERFGQALNLDGQGDGFWVLEMQQPALAAWWQARQIAQAIGMSITRKLDNLFNQVAQVLGPQQFAQLESDLAAHAEEWRTAGVAALQQGKT